MSLRRTIPGLAGLLLVAACARSEPAPAPSVSVRVVDASGRPVSGAHVRAERLAAPRPEDVRKAAAVTDADGRAVLAGLDAAAEHRLEASPLALGNAAVEQGRALGVPFPTPKFEPVTVATWRPRDDEIRVAVHPRVVLRAVDARDGKPVPGARFHLSLSPNSSTPLSAADASGTSEMWVEKGARLRVQATAHGSDVTSEAGAWTEVAADTGEATFRLDSRPQRIRLRVSGRSRGAGLRWHADGPSGRIGLGPIERDGEDACGVDCLGLLPDATYDVRLWEVDGESQGWALVKGLRPSEDVVDVALSRGVEVRGRLRGVPPTGVEVTAKPSTRGGPLERASSPVDSEGRFSLRLPPGTWRVGAVVQHEGRWLRAGKQVVVGETPVEVDLVVE